MFFAKSAQHQQRKRVAGNCELRRVCKSLKRRDRVFHDLAMAWRRRSMFDGSNCVGSEVEKLRRPAQEVLREACSALFTDKDSVE